MNKDIMDKWQPLIENDSDVDLTVSRDMFDLLSDQIKIKEFGNKGVLAYIITNEFNQERSFSELFLYVMKEHRGSFKLLNKIKSFIETEARATNCDVIKIGANFGFNDDGFKRVLERWGFVPDTYRKEIL